MEDVGHPAKRPKKAGKGRRSKVKGQGRDLQTPTSSSKCLPNLLPLLLATLKTSQLLPTTNPDSDATPPETDIDSSGSQSQLHELALSHLLKSGLLASPDSALASTASSPSDVAQRLAALLAASSNMKVPNLSLPGSMQLPFSPELLWRYPNPFIPQPPPSPLETQLKAHLPVGLGPDPRLWSRDDVTVFLRYCEREFDLDKIDMDRFQMNGKALCLLNKADLAERCAGAGDVIHNILQLLVREASGFPPSSPLTPRPPGLMTPTSPAFPPHSPHPWPLLNGAAAVAAAASVANGEAVSASTSTSASAMPTTQSFPNLPNLSHLINQTNSVTLSPSPSLDSQNGGSPKHGEPITSIHQLYPTPSGPGGKLHVPPPLVNRAQSASSSHSDSEDSQENVQRSPAVSASKAKAAPRSPNLPSSSSSPAVGGREETPELNTNGRLLWDFLQQLLNDSQQKYTSYIAWKDKESGVFKIVDPAGLAKLWGIQKNHLSMNYDKMSRALRYYYRVNILRKVQGERHCYQFLRNPSELKSIKNISLLRQQMEAQAAAQQAAAQQAAQAAIRSQMSAANSADDDQDIKVEVDEPTDLTMDAGEKLARRQSRERAERERYLAEATRGRTASLDRDGQDKRRSSDLEAEIQDKRRRLDAVTSAAATASSSASIDFRRLIPQVSLKTTDNY